MLFHPFHSCITKAFAKAIYFKNLFETHIKMSPMPQFFWPQPSYSFFLVHQKSLAKMICQSGSFSDLFLSSPQILSCTQTSDQSVCACEAIMTYFLVCILALTSTSHSVTGALTPLVYTVLSWHPKALLIYFIAFNFN